MYKIMIKLIKWISHKMGYKIAMIKIGGEVPGLTIDGDKELLQYVDITGYTFKKDPLKRIFPKVVEPEPIKPLTDKLLSICGSADKTYGYNDIESITQLTEEQRVQVEVELIKHFDFDKIVWMDFPTGLTEDKKTAISAKSLKISDSDNPTYKHKIGYVYTISFTPKMYDPGEMYKSVKDGCVFSPIIYNPETFEPKQSITISWSPDFPQDIDAPVRTYEDDKQMIRDMLEKVLDSTEEYRPKGFIGCLIRFAAV